ncbi:MAG: Dabb family protein [Gammaproteobacteria bacterium]|nr:Dabb family protein [Gammaproteobacteria bacterium]MCW5583377.1 Dabb family protein [Gammaproteobacteria bacterium]
MSIKHIVLLPFKSSLKKDDIEKIMLALAELKKDIPQIMSFSWGENNSPENLHRGYLHGFVMEFKDDKDRKIYLEHPAHIRIAEEIVLPALVDGINSPIVFDYTF